MASEKIKKLRAWMKTQELDAYIVPHADRFQSEYLSARDERLAWLTGFTGSAGMAVILAEHAALFTDGRYTLQAPQQVDGNVIDVLELPHHRPTQYLADHLKEKARVGYDPFLFTVAQLAAFQKSADACGFEMVGVEENPIDLLWTDRPPENIVEAELHDVRYAGQTIEEKIAAIIAKMEEDAESVLVAEPGLVCWLLNLRGRDVAHNPMLHSAALVGRDGHAVLFTDLRKINDAVRKALGNHVALESLDALFDVLASQKKSVQIDPTMCPVAIRDYLRQKKIEVVTAEDPSLLLRAAKNDTEIKGAQNAHEKDRKAFAVFLEWYHARDFAAETITELDIVAKLRECRMTDADFVDDSFDTIAGYGSNGAIVHYHADEASNLRLKPGSLLLLDSGAQYRCGTTDITRTLAVGAVEDIHKIHYTAVLQGMMALSMARFPKGTTGAQLDGLARAPIWEIGLDYSHGTGHGVGSFLSVHEGPQGFSSKSTVPLVPGMILSVEPGIYVTNSHGIRLENLVVVVADTRPGDSKEMLALKTLTHVPFESDLILWDKLTPREIAFLKDFDTIPPCS